MKRNIDSFFSENIASIAGQVNYACFSGHRTAALNPMVELYNTANGYEAKRLLLLDPNKAQTVGLAYMWFAILFDNNGDTDVNDVAAENALLCLAMSYFEKGNSFTLPAIFTLLNKHQDRLDDAISRVLKSTFYYGPINPEGFHKYNIDGYKLYRLSIMYHCLMKFYDIDNDSFTIPTDLPYFLPRKEDIHTFLDNLEDYDFWGKESLSDIGYDKLKELYESIVAFIGNM